MGNEKKAFDQVAQGAEPEGAIDEAAEKEEVRRQTQYIMEEREAGRLPMMSEGGIFKSCG